jgi:hypothetical protein
MPRRKRPRYRPKPLVYYCPECPCTKGFVHWLWSTPYPECPVHKVKMVRVKEVEEDETNPE